MIGSKVTNDIEIKRHYPGYVFRHPAYSGNGFATN